MSDNQSSETVFILADGPGLAEGVRRFADTDQITVEKLREHLDSFVRKIGGALSGVASALGEYELAGVEVEASFNAEKGFVFIAKAGVEGSVKLRFERKRPGSGN